jgi:hypothetical protein
VVAEAVALAGSAAVALDVLELGTHPEGEKRKRSIRQAAARYPGASRRRLRPQGTPNSRNNKRHSSACPPNPFSQPSFFPTYAIVRVIPTSDMALIHIFFRTTRSPVLARKLLRYA